jgi:hypothetical protein
LSGEEPADGAAAMLDFGEPAGDGDHLPMYF